MRIVSIIPLLAALGCATEPPSAYDEPAEPHETLRVPDPSPATTPDDEFAALRRELDARIERDQRVAREALSPEAPPVATDPRTQPKPEPSSEPRVPGSGRRGRGIARLSPEIRVRVEKLLHPDSATAMKAFWVLVEVDARFIPELIGLVESDEPTNITKFRVVVKDSTFRGYYASNIPGMGRMEVVETVSEEGALATDRVTWKAYDGRISCGVSGNGNRFADIKKADGFPLGIVMRAVLLNRFRSSRYPTSIDHTRELRRWWLAYHDLVFGTAARRM